MCGRFNLHSTAEVVKHLFGLKTLPEFDARYNIAPTEPVLMVRETDRQGREGVMARWGFIPSWAKDPERLPLMINAKAETVLEKPAFRAAVKDHRCLLPADGFYEWRTLLGGEKQPLLIRPKEEGPMALAGLWSRWHGTFEGEPYTADTCVILTTDANDLVRPVHDRMPVVVPRSEWDVWLDPAMQDEATIEKMLVPLAAEKMEMWPVSPRLNKAGVEGPELIRKEGQQALF